MYSLRGFDPSFMIQARFASEHSVVGIGSSIIHERSCLGRSRAESIDFDKTVIEDVVGNDNYREDQKLGNSAP